MSFDLYVWPLERPLNAVAAAREVAGLAEADAVGPPRDPRLAAFVDELRARHPWLAGDAGSAPGPTADRPFELDTHATHVFAGIGWADVELVGSEIADAAWRHGLAVFDPQREVVALPAALGGTPMSWEGIEPHVAAVDGWIKHVGEVLDEGSVTETDLMRRLSEDAAAMGFRVESPMGFELTPDMMAETMADPSRVPTALQTPERKARLLADLRTRKRGVRARAVSQLAGWDPDPEVRTALRELIEAGDPTEQWEAADGLRRQRDVDSLDAVVEAVRRASPAGGGDAGSMLLPLRSALDLAAMVGPEKVARVRALGREWRGPRPARPKPWDDDLDELLA